MFFNILLVYVFGKMIISIVQEGYVFRLVIGHMREVSLAKMSKTQEGSVQSLDTDESQRLLKEYSGRPKLTSTLHG